METDLMVAEAINPEGAHTIMGRTIPDLERAADALGATVMRVPVDGGIERFLRLGNQWVAL